MGSIKLPYSKQFIDNDDISHVGKVLSSNYITTGPKIIQFENKIKNLINVKFATSTSSGSAALHIACKALGIKKGDLVWSSPITFISTLSGAIHCGANIDFVDIDSETFNISISKVEDKLIKAKQINKLPKLIIPVHIGGLSCDMKNLYYLSKKYNFKIIEDASHAFGAKYKKLYVGNCKYSDISVFSFHPVKIITTGEGGVAVTNKRKLRDKLVLYRDNGIERNHKNFKKNIREPWYYEQQELGYNYRLSDIHSALGISQIKKTNKFIKERNRLAKIYKKILDPNKVKYQKIHSWTHSSYHLFIVLLDKKIRNLIIRLFRKKGIFVNLHYIPVFFHPFYKNKFKLKDYPNTKMYFERAVSLPLFYGLKKKDQIKVAYIINNFT